MTILEINNRITFYTSLDTAIYLPADRLVAINNAYDKLHSIILDSQDEWDFDDSNYTDLPIATTTLTANTNTLALPPTIYRLNKTEINYGSGYVKALPLDLNETGLSEAEVLERANANTPYYRVFGNVIKFYPTPTTDATVQLYFDREIEKFTSAEVTTGTKVPGFDALFHDYIVLQASIDGAVKYNLNNLNVLETKAQEMEQRIRKYYGKKTTDRKLKLTNFIEDYE